MSSQDEHESPLHEYAARASQELGKQSTDVKNSSVARVESGQVSLRESFAQHVQASATYMEDAAAGVVNTNTLEASDVAIGVASVNSLQAGTLQVGVLAARQIEGKNIRAGLLVSLQVHGDVHSVVSPLAGVAIGAGLFGMYWLVRALETLFKRRESKG